MKPWKKSGKSLGWLIDRYVTKGESLSQICWDNDISPGFAGLGEMSAALKEAGYTIRSASRESAEKRSVTKDNLYEQWGIPWDELVEWYNSRKPLTVLCGKYGYGARRSVVLMRLLRENGALNDDVLRGFGFTKDELIKMYTEGGLSICKIRSKFNLSRHAGTIMASLLREAGIRGKGLKIKGGGTARYTSDDGYVRVVVNEENRRFTTIRVGGTEMEHRLVVATMLGRPLKRNEWVHHINRDGSDNRPANLLLVDKDNHRRIHISMDKVIEELYREGRLALNGTDGSMGYQLKESDDYTRGFSDGMQAILEME